MQDNLNLVLTMLSAGFFGIIIAFIYNLAHSRAILSRKMQLALVIYAMIPALMLYLNFNIGGIALIGAITIMRFREPIKDHRDLVYIFWAVASGFACAAHQFMLLGIGSLILVMMLMLLGAFRNQNRVLLVIRAADTAESLIVEEIADMKQGYLKMLHNNSKDGVYTELIYEIRNKCDDKITWGENFKKELYLIKGVEEVNIIYQQDDMGI